MYCDKIICSKTQGSSNKNCICMVWCYLLQLLYKNLALFLDSFPDLRYPYIYVCTHIVFESKMLLYQEPKSTTSPLQNQCSDISINLECYTEEKIHGGQQKCIYATLCNLCNSTYHICNVTIFSLTSTVLILKSTPRDEILNTKYNALKCDQS